MSINRYTPTIPASGVVESQGGNFMLLLAASGSVSLRLENGGHAEQFNGVTGGLLVRRIVPWDNARILGAPGVTLEFFYGNNFTDKDETDVRLQIATIAGVAATRIQPFSSVTNRTPVAAANGAQSTLFAANALRQTLRVFVDENNAGTCYARVVGGANNIANLQPGSVYTFPGLYGLDVRNDTGLVANFYIFEEN